MTVMLPEKGNVIVYSATCGFLVAVTVPADKAADDPVTAMVCTVEAVTPPKPMFRIASWLFGADATVGLYCTTMLQLAEGSREAPQDWSATMV